MLKILRKYNKIILVVGGVILMIAFTLPQLPQLFGASAFSRQVAVVEGEIIRGRDWDTSRQQFAAVQQMFNPAILGVEDFTHYFLLSHEAAKYGFVGGPDDAATAPRAFAPIIATQEAIIRQQNGDFALAFELQQDAQAVFDRYADVLERRRSDLLERRQVRTGEAGLDAGLANLRGILRLRQAYSTLPFNAKPEATDIALDLFDRAVADVAVIGIGDVAARAELLEEDALAEFFDRYADQRPEDNEFRIGYLRPDAARVEYLVVDRSALVERLDAEPIDVRMFYDNLPEERRVAIGEFRENRDRVERLYKLGVADDLLSEIASGARSTILSARQRALEPDRFNQAYYDFTEEWEQVKPTLASLTQRLSDLIPQPADNRAVTGAVIEQYADDGVFYSADELNQRPILGGAGIRLNERQELTPATLLFLSRELISPEDPPALRNLAATIPVQAGLFVAQPLRTDQGDLVFLRFTTIRQSSPPPTWREVEDEVRQDLAETLAYEELIADLELYASAMAAATSLDEFEANVDDVTASQAGVIVSSDAVRRSVNGRAFVPADRPAFREAVMNLVDDWDPMLDVSSLPASERSLAVGAPAQRTVVAAKITGRYPLSLQDFERAPAQIANAARQRSNALAEESPMSLEAVSRRLGFRNLLGEDE